MLSKLNLKQETKKLEREKENIYFEAFPKQTFNSILENMV